MKNYSEILHALEESIQNLEATGVTVKPLNERLEELKRHSENVGKLENNLEAIRSEILDPVRLQLDRQLVQNQRAGKFSILGFYFGAAGFLAAIISLFLTNQANLDERLVAIEQALGIEGPVMIPAGLTSIRLFQSAPVLTWKGQTFSIELYDVNPVNLGEQEIIGAGLRLFVDGRQIGWERAREIMAIESEIPALDDYQRLMGIPVFEGDILNILDKEQWVVRKIRTRNPFFRETGDEADEIYIEHQTTAPD